jgi:hypothetical protein
MAEADHALSLACRLKFVLTPCSLELLELELSASQMYSLDPHRKIHLLYAFICISIHCLTFISPPCDDDLADHAGSRQFCWTKIAFPEIIFIAIIIQCSVLELGPVASAPISGNFGAHATLFAVPSYNFHTCFLIPMGLSYLSSPRASLIEIGNRGME